MRLNKTDIVVKIENGTTVGSKNLCKTCRNSTVVRGHNNKELIRCGALEQMVPFTVAECSSHSDKNTPTLYDMEEVAWRLITTKKNGNVGFVDAREFERRQRTERKESDVAPS